MMYCVALRGCSDIELFCPSSGTCKISSDALNDHVTQQTAMVIHAIHGWLDVDLAGYAPTLSDDGNVLSIAEDGRWHCVDTTSPCNTGQPTGMMHVQSGTRV